MTRMAPGYLPRRLTKEEAAVWEAWERWDEWPEEQERSRKLVDALEALGRARDVNTRTLRDFLTARRRDGDPIALALVHENGF